MMANGDRNFDGTLSGDLGRSRAPTALRMPISIPIVLESGETLTVEHEDGPLFFVTPTHFKPTTNITAGAEMATGRGGNERKVYRPGPKSKTKDEHYEKAEQKKAAVAAKSCATDLNDRVEVVAFPSSPEEASRSLDVQEDAVWPFAPELKIQYLSNRRRLVLMWDMDKTVKPLMARLRVYELYMSSERRNDGRWSPWRKVCSFGAKAIPFGCVVDSLPCGQRHVFGVRAVDVNGKPTLFIKHWTDL